MYMNGCIHLKNNKENKNRYHVLLSLAAITARYPQIIAGTMAAIIGYQFRIQKNTHTLP